MGDNRGNDEFVGGVYHRISRKITGKMPRRVGEEGWEFLPDRRGYRGGGEVANSGICMEAVGKNCVIYFDKVNL